MWVAYKDSVYDITDYLKRHPGGMNYISIAAGGYLEPYFLYYKFHDTNKDVQDLL
jgi:cytochrome b involved in lipid metabolism